MHSWRGLPLGGWHLAAMAVGAIGGFVLGMYIYELARLTSGGRILLPVTMVEGAVFAYLGTPVLARAILGVRTYFSTTPTHEILTGFLGMTGGLVVAALIGTIIHELPYGTPLTVLAAIALGALGAKGGSGRGREILDIVGLDRNDPDRLKGRAIILDTSVFIDGRLPDLIKTGVLPGEMVVPHAVARELQKLTDSDDPAKRAKGRRGLEVMAGLHQDSRIKITVVDEQVADDGVDEHLLQLARELKCPVLTLDYGLTGMARGEGVLVVNLHELATALRPPVLPGAEMTLAIIREGRQPDQGVAYLEDGTMVVIEGGKSMVGRTVRVKVQQVNQTVSGRMVFAVLDGEQGGGSDGRDRGRPSERRRRPNY